MASHPRKGLSAKALSQLYGGHGNFIAWAGEPPAAPSDAPSAVASGVAFSSPPAPAPLALARSPGACAAPPDSSASLAPSAPPPAADAVARATAAALLPDIVQGHHTFTRVLTSRLTEVRELRGIWAGPGGLEALLAAVCESCHESVAADVLHALASCRGSAAPGGAQLIGGLPRWSWPHAASIGWLESVAPVLETLLFSVVEDYLATATAAVGHVQEALGGLWAVAERCTPRDLRLGGDDEDDGGGGEGKDDEGAAGGGADAAKRRHAAAVQAVEAVRLTTPVLAALRHCAGQYKGRVQRAAAARLERLVEMHAAVGPLVAAAAAAPLGFV